MSGLLAYSGAVAKEKGLCALTVDTVMRGIGRTGSMFYTLFASKKELYQALVEQELAFSIDRFSPSAPAGSAFNQRLEGTPSSASQIDTWIEQVLIPYLSSSHVEAPSKGCALASLSTDIGRCDIGIRASYETAIGKIVAECKQISGCSDATAWTVITQCIGAVIVARALASDNARSVVLQSTVASVKSALTAQPYQDSI